MFLNISNILINIWHNNPKILEERKILMKQAKSIISVKGNLK